MGWTGFRFPEEKPEIDPNDLYKDPVALMEYREWQVRRKQIDIEKAKVGPDHKFGTNFAQSAKKVAVESFKRNVSILKLQLHDCYKPSRQFELTA